MQFVWDENKNAANKKKHGISFETAVNIFDDPFRVEIYDDLHSVGENRWQIIGSTNNAVLFVVETELAEDVVRIISARPATKTEKRAYYGIENN